MIIGDYGEEIYEGGDSTVTIFPGSLTILKRYRYFSELWICQYIDLHSILSRESGYIEFAHFFHASFGKSLQKVEFAFLDLGKDISGFIAKKLGIKAHVIYNGQNKPHVVRCNMKIISFEGGILKLIVTDIGNSITRLILQNKGAISRLIDLQL